MSAEIVVLSFLAFGVFLVVVGLTLLILYCPPKRRQRNHITPKQLRNRVLNGERLRIVK